MVRNPSNKIKTESINEIILRLLGLKPGIELDYQSYHDLIKKKLSIVRLSGKEILREEDELLRGEFKRIRKLKDKKVRFKVKKIKVKNITQTTTPKEEHKKLPSSGLIIPSRKGIISPRDIIPTKVEDVPEEKKNNFSQIQKTLDSILKILGSKFKFDQKQQDQERRDEEIKRRGKKEATLERFKKGVSGIVATTKKMLSPFQNVIDRIWRFIFFTLLGRAFTKFMDWMSDNQNRKKFDALIEFLADHWPAIAGLYILFGTSFGKLVRGLLKGATRMIVALAMNAKKIGNFIRKNNKLAFLGVAIAPLVTRELGNILGENKETSESKLIPKSNSELDEAKKTIDKTKNVKIPQQNQGGIIQKFNSGGLIAYKESQPKLQGFDLGGLITSKDSKEPYSKLQVFNLGGLIQSFKMGGFNSFSDTDFFSGVPITGAGADDTLIAAKTGEAILTEKDQEDLNQRYVERATGEPLNIPQYLAGRKPGFVAMSNLKFPGFRGGFSDGGLIHRFNTGGIVGGLDFSSRNFKNVFGRDGESYERFKRNETEMSDGGWFGERLGKRKGEKTTTSSFKGFQTGGMIGLPNIKQTYKREKNNLNNRKMLGSFTPTDTTLNIPTTNTTKYAEELYSNEKRKNTKLFQSEGIINNVKNFFGNVLTGSKAKAVQMKPSWYGPAPIPDYKTPEGKALLKTIRVAEHYKDANPYTAIYGGGTAPITKMTVQEVIQMGNTGKLPLRFGGGSIGYASGSSATGAYQFMPFTLQNLIKRGIVKPNEIMTPEVQDRLGWELASSRGVNIRSLKKTGLSQNTMDKIAPEWASFPYSSAGGSSYYGQPVKGADFLRKIYKQELTKKQKGGPVQIKKVDENEGTKIPGATADRRLFPIVGGGKAALQPGEYVLPVDTVNRVGLSFIEKLVASTDSNSDAFLKKGKVNKPEITPYITNSNLPGVGNIITLPPIVQSASFGSKARASGYGGGSRVPSFSHVAERNDRGIIAQIYGIEDII